MHIPEFVFANVTAIRPGMVTKGKPIETEFLLITAHNNAIRTNYSEAKIDNKQQNSKRRLRID